MNSFLYIPSPIYAFRNSKGYIIPKLITDEESIQTLYLLRSDDMTPIRTTYARTRTASLAPDEYRIQDSIKGGIRQYYRDDFFFVEPKFVIVCATIRYDYKTLLVDICKFPMNPSANMFLASDLAIERNPQKIKQYLHSNGIFNITQFDYYPDYYLFFLLTRFYSYPYTPIQLQLAEERNNATEFQKRAIDSIFENKDALQYLEAIMTNSLNFESKYDVSSWIGEYIVNSNKEKLVLNPNEYQTVISLSEILYSWTDNEIAAPSHGAVQAGCRAP